MIGFSEEEQRELDELRATKTPASMPGLDFDNLEESIRAREAWCETEEGRGWSVIAQRVLDLETKRDTARREGRALRDREKSLMASGIPRRAREVLVNPERTEALTRATSWLHERTEREWVLILSGPKGTGKSIAAAKALMDMKHPAGVDWGGVRYWDPRAKEDRDTRRWWSCTDLSVVDGYSGEYTAICEADGPIVLDDLGSEYADKNGFFFQRLDRLIDCRYREYRPTIITTNLAARDFKERYGERVSDRIREGGVFFELRGASMRAAPRAVA